VRSQLNDVLSLGLHRVWKRAAVKWSGAVRGHTALDVCCGSGDLAFLLAEAVGADGQVVRFSLSLYQIIMTSSQTLMDTMARHVTGFVSILAVLCAVAGHLYCVEVKAWFSAIICALHTLTRSKPAVSPY